MKGTLHQNHIILQHHQLPWKTTIILPDLGRKCFKVSLKIVKRAILAETDSNAAKTVPTKNTSKPPEKRDFAEKTVANLNKTVLGSVIKNQ
jgi:hypothetical protein